MDPTYIALAYTYKIFIFPSCCVSPFHLISPTCYLVSQVRPANPKILYSLLKEAVQLAAGLGEFTLIFNTWIISPPTAYDERSCTWLIPSFWSIIFAMSEPLYMWVFTRIPLEPIYLAFMVPVTQTLLFFAFWEIKDFAALERAHAASIDAQNTDTTAETQHEATINAIGLKAITMKCGGDLGPRTFQALALAHVQTAAATTGSLLLGAQNMDVTRNESHTLHVFLVACALVYFGLSRAADYTFARYAQLPCYIGQKGTAYAMEQVKNLLWLIAVRAGVRLSLGESAVSGPFGNDGAGAESFFEELTLREMLESIPLWAWCAASALNLCLMFIGVTIKQRAQDNVRAGRLD